MAIVVETPIPIGSGLDLRAIWLNVAADLSDACQLRRVGDSFSVTPSTRAEVRQLAGRRRIVRHDRDRVYESYSITFQRCSPEQLRWLRGHVGVLLCLRDHVGSKTYGMYAEAPREVGAGRLDPSSVSIRFDEVDHSEAVTVAG